MLQNSLKKIALVSGGNVGNAAIGFFYLAVVAKTLSLDDFGKYALLTSILLVFAKLIDFGSNSIYVTNSVQSADKNVTESFHTIKILMLFAIIPISIIVVSIFFPNQPLLYFYFIGGLVAYTLNFTLYAHFQRDEKFLLLVLLNTLPSIFKIGAAVLIIGKIINIDYVSAFALFSLSIFMDIFLIPYLSRNSKYININLSQVINILKHSFPSAVSQIVQEGWPAANNAIAKTIKGFSDVGLYSLAGKISNIFSLISLSVFTVLLPKNAKRKGENKAYDINETLLISLGIIALAFAASTISELFLKVVFGDKFQGSITILGVLIFSAAITSIHSFTENYFLVEKVTKHILVINLIKVFVFLLLATSLTHNYGIEGLAYANLVSAIVALLITILMIFSHQKKLLYK